MRSPSALRLAAVAALAIALAACGREVRVSDPSGAPIAGATVVAVAPSTGSDPATTGSDGVARVGSAVGEQWLSVSKEGYRSHFTRIPQRFPATVTLQPGVDAPPPAKRTERTDSTWTPIHEKE